MISTLYIYTVYIYICMYNISHVWLYDNQFFVYPSHRHRLLRIIHQGVQGGAQRGTLLDQPTPFAARFFSPKTWKKTWSLKKNAVEIQQESHSTKNGNPKGLQTSMRVIVFCMTPKSPIIPTQESRIIFSLCW